MATVTTPQSPRAFVLSLLLHASVVLLLVLIGWYARQREEPPEQIFELVAGAGDDYMAKEAPTTDAPIPTVKMPPLPEPVVSTPPAPVIEPAPEPTPAPPKEVTPPPKKETPPTPKKKETPPPTPKVEKVEKAPPTPKIEKAPERISYDKFAKQNPIKTQPTKAPPPIQAKKIDLNELGRVSSSTRNAVDKGAGGPAMTRQEVDQWKAYQSLLVQKVRQAMQAAGFNEIRTVGVEFRISATGTISAPSITRSSGSGEFDAGVLSALRSIRMPPPPGNRAETIAMSIEFREHG